MKCTHCNEDLVSAKFCHSCSGAGCFYGDFDDLCLTCNGTGEPRSTEESVTCNFCVKCRLIYYIPTNERDT